MFNAVAGTVPDRYLTSRAGIYAYVYNSIDTPGEPLLQLIISREQRMMGMEFYVEWLDKTNSPDVVLPQVVYWSVNTKVPILGFGVVLLSLAALELCFAFFRVHQKFARGQITRGGVLYEFTSPDRFVQCATIIAPLIAQALTQHLTYANSMAIKGLCIVFMSFRVFLKSQILKPLKVVIRPVVHAGSQFASVIVVIAFMSTVLGVVYGMLFGVFDEELFMSTTGLASKPTLWARTQFFLTSAFMPFQLLRGATRLPRQGWSRCLPHRRPYRKITWTSLRFRPPYSSIGAHSSCGSSSAASLWPSWWAHSTPSEGTLPKKKRKTHGMSLDPTPFRCFTA